MTRKIVLIQRNNGEKKITTLILKIIISVSSSILTYEQHTRLSYKNVNITHVTVWWEK